LLPAPTQHNEAHKTTQIFVIYGDAWVDERVRVNKVLWKMVARRAVGEEVAAAFEDALVV
jgi:hypothetical protein